MARVIREEVQDKDGNIHYFHTEDCIVFGEDGRNLREAMGSVQFEDYTVEGTEIPDAETALAGITKGKKWTALFSNIKAFCKGVVLLSRVVDSENITEDGYLMSGKKCSEMFQEVSVKLHPIGSIYISFDATDPALLFGGTWEQIQGRFLLAASDEYEAESIGGEATHKLTVTEMPSHSHSYQYTTIYAFPYNSASDKSNLRSNETSKTTSAVGGGQPHNNMPPYLAVYMWKRTS